MIHPAQVAAFVGFFALVMAVGLLLKDYVTEASLQQVRAAVAQGPDYDAQTAEHSQLEGLGMPKWQRFGWRLVGGRTDQLEDHRDAITGFYRRGDAQIAYTVIAGTGGVDHEQGVGEVRAVLSIARTVDDHTVVLTGWPVSDELAGELRELAQHPGT